MYDSYEDWYDNGPGSENFKRKIREQSKVKVGKIELPCQCKGESKHKHENSGNPLVAEFYVAFLEMSIRNYKREIERLKFNTADLKHAVNWYFEMQSHPVPESCVNDNPHALKTWDEFRKMRESSKQQLIEMVKGE